MSPVALAGTTFSASAVEFVEAATIVFAVGVTSGWRAALTGTIAAMFALIALVAIGSPLLASAASVRIIEAIAGVFMLFFGARWMRKVVLRYAGIIPMHDENAIYAREVARLRTEHVQGFAVAFQGVFIEGLEVAIVVVTFAATSPSQLPWSWGGALAAFVVVTLAAIALRAPFSRVPENLLKAIVSVMLLALGTFWSGEGFGLRWPLGDATLLVLILGCVALLVALVYLAKIWHPKRPRSYQS
jgi:Ca2+/H+ antiporter, TMEM165/GDT1 family